MLFRVDSLENFKQIKDSSFRMRRWDNGMWNQDVLMPIYRKMHPDQGLYRMCFFRSYEYLIESAGGMGMFDREFVVHAIPEEVVYRHANVVVMDTAFAKEVAILVYRVETLDNSNSEWSIFGMPISKMDKLSSRSVVMDFEAGRKLSSLERFMRIIRRPWHCNRTTLDRKSWISDRSTLGAGFYSEG